MGSCTLKEHWKVDGADHMLTLEQSRQYLGFVVQYMEWEPTGIYTDVVVCEVAGHIYVDRAA